jgi:hypothetical protein
MRRQRSPKRNATVLSSSTTLQDANHLKRQQQQQHQRQRPVLQQPKVDSVWQRNWPAFEAQDAQLPRLVWKRYNRTEAFSISLGDLQVGTFVRFVATTPTDET